MIIANVSKEEIDAKYSVPCLKEKGRPYVRAQINFLKF